MDTFLVFTGLIVFLIVAHAALLFGDVWLAKWRRWRAERVARKWIVEILTRSRG